MNARFWMIGLGVLAVGCTTPPGDCEPQDAPWQDADGDGYVAADDCADDDPSVYPGAFEACDGIDNDCDGQIDEIFGDSDGDGIVDCRDIEECDGVDNDGDGYIDEGSADYDEDGIPDCLDEDCDLSVPKPAPVAADYTCRGTVEEVVDPWSITIEWDWTALSTNREVGAVYMTPSVGHLDDDDGDGVIGDPDDNPEIVVIATADLSSGGTIVVLDGKTGAEESSFTGSYGFAATVGTAIADVDADGINEIVAVENVGDGYLEVVAYTVGGTRKWGGSSYYKASFPITHPTVSDIDADGNPEVLFEGHVYDGLTGRLELDLTSSVSWSSDSQYQQTVAADLDGDGTQEIFFAGVVWSHTGAVEWRTSASRYAFPAVLDYDGDAEGELLLASDQGLTVYDDNGTVLWREGTESSFLSEPCVADFDGDGKAEFGYVDASRSELVIRELDAGGTELWSQKTIDQSGLATCSAFDFNADGAYEVLFEGENLVQIYDGATGTVLFEDSYHSSATGFEYPVIADVDNDGAAEVIAINNPGFSEIATTGIVVYGHDGAGWAPSGTSWGQYDFRVGNVTDSGAVPVTPPMPWQDDNLVHGRPAVAPFSPNLFVLRGDDCLTGCEDTNVAKLAFSVGNDGAADATGVTVGVYAVDGVTWTEVATFTVDLPYGADTQVIETDIAVGDFGVDGLVIAIDPDDLVDECDETDNLGAYEPVCL